jgi:nitroimidazol reductase NimA-like FMN-containing flavoprotein (pyridoxamine 5'-phosphate oxidase superfamily)
LWGHHVGRVGFVDEGEVHVLPVLYHFHDGKVVFRSALGAKLDAAMRRAPVAFEVDGWDDQNRAGWSVLVRGTAHEVEDPDTVKALDHLGLEVWIHGPHPLHWVEIAPTEVTGRRIPRTTS